MHLRQNRRGSHATIVLFSLIPMMTVAALALDTAVARHRVAQVHVAIDAGSLAAMTELSLGQGQDVAEARAVGFADLNPTNNLLTFSTSDIEWGTWNGTSFSSDTYANADAVRVVLSTDIPTTMSGLLGVNNVTASRTSVAYLDTPPGGSGCGFFSAGNSSIGGMVDFDAYDSTAGVYDAVTNGGEIGGTCSNGNMTVSGGSGTLAADIYAGPSANFNVSGSPNFLGDTGNMASEITFPTVDCTAVEYPPGSGSFYDFTDSAIADGERAGVSHGGELSFENGTHTLGNSGTAIPGDGGDFPDVYGVYLGKLALSGMAAISLPAPTLICVDGAVQLRGGGVANAGNDPHNFTVMATENVEISGNTDFYGTAISNKNAQVSGTADVFGLIAGNDAANYSGTVNMHMDLTLPEYWGLVLPSDPVIVLVQ